MINKVWLTTFIISLCLIHTPSVEQPIYVKSNFKAHDTVTPYLNFPLLVDKLYELNGNKLKWFTPGEQSIMFRKQLKLMIDSADLRGLQKNKYHHNKINESVNKFYPLHDSVYAMQIDRIYTDAAIAFCKDIYQGLDINKWMLYDEISKKYEESDDNFLLNNLNAIRSASGFSEFIHSLEPNTNEYLILRNKWLYHSKSFTPIQKKQINTSLNFIRWINHFHFNKYIVVNIPSATLKYYENDSLKLSMKLVVGKTSTKTPRFAAYCNQVILYPYWNVPTSIAINELLPKIKRNPKYIDDSKMQLLNAKGKVVNHYNLNWRKYSSKYFPFRLRQSTGCDNSLGVIKFDLTSPFSVYLHDTNNKNAFLSATRFLSHGCIRLAKPIDLANNILINKIDDKFIKACLKGQLPVPLNLDKPVPVFVVYQTVEVQDKNELNFYKDIYGLLK